MVLAVAQDTHFSAAPATAGIFPSRCQINANLARFDPIPAALGGTIQVLGSRVLFELLVPESLELIIEQTIDMLQWDVLLSAAAWWHVGRIFDRESELSLQTCVTHTMAAGELCSFGDGDIVVHTDKTIDPDVSSIWRCMPRQDWPYLCTSLMDGERGPALKKVAKIPPEPLRVGCSLVEYDLATGGAAGTADSLTTLGRRVGLIDRYLLLGSRAETLLMLVSMTLPSDSRRKTYLPNFGSSTRREEPEPDRGVYAVRLEDPPSSLLLRPDDLLTSVDLGRP